MMILGHESLQSADKAGRILEAARGLFMSIGLKNTSIEEIATKAGLGKGTVYLYFKSKEEIFLNLAENFHRDLHIAIDEACNAATTPTDKLRAYVETRIRFWARTHQVYGLNKMSLYEAMSTPTSFAVRKPYIAGDMEMIKSILEEGISRGEFSFSNPSRVAAVLFSMLDALSLPWDQEGSLVSSEEIVKSYSSLLLNGLATR